MTDTNMTTHQLAKMLLKEKDLPLYIDDEPIENPAIEKTTSGENLEIIILWTKE